MGFIKRRYMEVLTRYPIFYIRCESPYGSPRF